MPTPSSYKCAKFLRFQELFQKAPFLQRFSVDGRPDRKNKGTFENFPDVVWTLPNYRTFTESSRPFIFVDIPAKQSTLEQDRTRKELSVASEPKSRVLYFVGFITHAHDFQMASWQPFWYPPKSLVGVFSYVNNFFCSNIFSWLLATSS